MAKCPDWYELKYIKVEDNNAVFDIQIKYIPLRFLLGVIRKSIGWRIWLYPRLAKICLDRIGIVFQPWREFKGF